MSNPFHTLEPDVLPVGEEPHGLAEARSRNGEAPVSPEGPAWICETLLDTHQVRQAGLRLLPCSQLLWLGSLWFGL